MLTANFKEKEIIAFCETGHANYHTLEKQDVWPFEDRSVSLYLYVQPVTFWHYQGNFKSHL